jgi:hypothetical protein
MIKGSSNAIFMDFRGLTSKKTLTFRNLNSLYCLQCIVVIICIVYRGESRLSFQLQNRDSPYRSNLGLTVEGGEYIGRTSKTLPELKGTRRH